MLATSSGTNADQGRAFEEPHTVTRAHGHDGVDESCPRGSNLVDFDIAFSSTFFASRFPRSP